MDNSIQLKHTPIGNDYWNEKAEYNQLLMDKYEELVPSQGEAETVHGEAVRIFHRLQYEYCNNGNCNACDVDMEEDDCWDCSGSGKVQCNQCYGDGEVEDDDENMIECDECNGNGEVECNECLGCGEIYDAIEKRSLEKDHYGAMLESLRDMLPDADNIIDDVIEVIVDNSDDFSDEMMYRYTKLGDAVAHFVLTTENEPREKTGIYE